MLAIHLLAIRFGWVDEQVSRPFFVMAPGLGLLAVAASDRTNKDALTPAGILLGISILGFLWTLGIIGFFFDLLVGLIKFIFRIVLPIALVALGGWMTLGRKESSEPIPESAFPEKIEPEVEMGAASAGAASAGIASGDVVDADVEAVFESEVEAEFEATKMAEDPGVSAADVADTAEMPPVSGEEIEAEEKKPKKAKKKKTKSESDD